MISRCSKMVIRAAQLDGSSVGAGTSSAAHVQCVVKELADEDLYRREKES